MSPSPNGQLAISVRELVDGDEPFRLVPNVDQHVVLENLEHATGDDFVLFDVGRRRGGRARQSSSPHRRRDHSYLRCCLRWHRRPRAAVQRRLRVAAVPPTSSLPSSTTIQPPGYWFSVSRRATRALERVDGSVRDYFGKNGDFGRGGSHRSQTEDKRLLIAVLPRKSKRESAFRDPIHQAERFFDDRV